MSKENKNEKTEIKSPIKKLIIIASIVIIGFIIICAFPFLCYAGAILYSLYIDIPEEPKIQHGEFPFELVYEYKGEQHLIKDTIVCDYEGYYWSSESGNSRDWTCRFNNDNELGKYTIDTINGSNIYIEVPEAADYYMGDDEYSLEDTHPLIIYTDKTTGTNYQEKYQIESVNIKIIEWTPSNPLKGNIN